MSTFATYAQSPANAAEAALVRQLEAARNLALFGADALARDLCASIFLNHAHLLSVSRTFRQRFVECLVLLGMTNLLARLLRATDGVGLSVARLASNRPQLMALSLSNGATLAIPMQDGATGSGARAEHASLWSDRILDAAESPALADAFDPTLSASMPAEPQRTVVRLPQGIRREVVLPSLG